MAKKKYYVVWKGHKTGIFTSWNICKKAIDGFNGAQYKSFKSLAEAEDAFKVSFFEYKENNKNGVPLFQLEKRAKEVNFDSINTDAACSGNPGKMEYRGVYTKTGKEIFKQGPFLEGTNNIGEFLALVHGLAFLQQRKSNLPIYSDSRIAIGWVKKKCCNTKLQQTAKNKDLFQLVKRAEVWLHNNTYSNPILKWNTKEWGEIPADFGRK
ncbi:ribonuclease H1 domain-containing protein [Mesonia aestuariivivens]|uniref:Ribonuclease H n=1 Tax=Mesonia aestuariivivens TaxID=2796128 RepID=A0ABS6VY54_9FLAO|nr:ribonuclease H family protein [Mesonia aestuariivivens]MBW2960212.1 ribonuclease H family protein [Mesonia aestuariivivens]